MKKVLLTCLIALVLSAGFIENSYGQTADTVKNWAKSGIFSLNMAQSSFTNWAAGGQPSFGLNGLINLTANYKKDKNAWDNSLTLAYGQLKQKNNAFGWVKTDDKIDLLSKYGRQASKVWYYSALASFKSQMSPGYTYSGVTRSRISDLFSPAYALLALGMDYKPNPVFSAFLSPLTAKITIVTDDALTESFGVEAGKNLRGEFGAYANLLFKKDEIIKNVNFMSKLDLFSNYLHNPQNIDVSWENLLVMKVNKFISATLSTHMLYDDDILINLDENGDDIFESTGKRVQFKEVLGVGFTYKFPN